MKNKIDVVVVAFRGESNFLRLQAFSLSKFFDKSILNSYNIIWNSDDSYDDVLNDILSENPELIDRVKFHPANKLLNGVTSNNGWRTQQVLKIVISPLLRGDFQYTLDAKNHFIRRVGYDDLFDVNGKPFFKKYNYIGDIFQENIKACLRYCSVTEQDDFLRQGLPTITPVMQYPHILKSMISYVEEKEGKSFSDAFINSESLARTTEFQLYYAFLLRDNKLEDIYSALTGYPFVTVFGSTINKTDEEISRYMRHALENECKVFGIHRKRSNNLREEETLIAKQIWSNAGLLEYVSKLGIIK